MRWIKLCALAIVGSISVIEVAESKEPRPALIAGMSIEDVLKGWGAPDDKTEREVKREEVWHYLEGDMTFREGKLVSYPGSDSGVKNYDTSYGAPSDPEGGTSRHSHTKLQHQSKNGKSLNGNVSIDDVFNEVLKSMPPDSDGAKPGRPGNSPPISNFNPPMGRAIPGRVADIDDDLE